MKLALKVLNNQISQTGLRRCDPSQFIMIVKLYTRRPDKAIWDTYMHPFRYGRGVAPFQPQKFGAGGVLFDVRFWLCGPRGV